VQQETNTGADHWEPAYEAGEEAYRQRPATPLSPPPAPQPAQRRADYYDTLGLPLDAEPPLRQRPFS
jgi:hypothetical protein